MDISRPHAAVGPSRDLDVLKILAGTTMPMTGRQIARLAGVAHTSVQVALERLVKHGLVRREAAGSALLYTLNRQHLATPAVESLANLWPEFIRRLRNAIGRWDAKPIHVSLFGSAARGDGDVTSDIDVFIVRGDDVHDDDPVWRDQIAGLHSAVRDWTGNDLGLVEMSLTDLERAKPASPLFDQVKREGIDIAGIPVRLLGTR